MKEWFTVGEIASLFGINVQTLHYYDMLGLFNPIRRQEETGARLYQFDQVYKLASIRFLKTLGYPLDKIKETIDNKTLALSLEEMRRQSAELQMRCDRLARIRDAIDRKVSFVEESLASLDLDAIKLKSFPGRGYIPLGSEENLYRQEDFYFYPTVVFYKGAEKRFGAMLTPDTPKGDLVPREIPEGEYLVGYHRGPYETISDSFRLVMERSKALGLRLDEEIIDINIIDQFVERDSRKYVTEIQCRLISG